MAVEPTTRVDLSGEWDVRAGSSGGYCKRYVPGVWDTGLKKTETYYYSRTVEVSPEDADKHAFVRFGGVDYACTVSWDDKVLGSHEGYFQPFWFDVGQLGGGHRLALEVTDPWEEPDGFDGWDGHIPKSTLQGVDPIAWGHNLAGVWRPVEVIIGDVFIHRVSCRYFPSESLARLELEVVSNPARLPIALTASASLVPPSDSGAGGALTAEQRTALVRPVTRLTISISIPSPALWSPDSPATYAATVNLIAGGRIIDSARREVGFKNVEIEGQHILVNGKPVFFRGLADYRFLRTFPIGAPSGYPAGGDPDAYYPLRSEEVYSRCAQFVRLLKEANCNIVRVPHFVMPEEFYEAADRLGLFVYNDFPLHWKHDLREMSPEWILDQFESFIWGLSPHPSAIIIACSNEFTSTPADVGIALLKKMLSVARSWDPTALLIGNSGAEGLSSWDWPNGAYGEPLDDDIADYHRYVSPRRGDPHPITSLANYIGRVFDRAADRSPFKPFFFSEFAVKLPREEEALFDSTDRLALGEDSGRPRSELEDEWTSLFGEWISFARLLELRHPVRTVLSAYWRQVQILEFRRRWDTGAAGCTVWHSGSLLKDLETPSPVSYDLIRAAYAPIALYARTRRIEDGSEVLVWVINDRPIGRCTLEVTGHASRQLTLDEPGVRLESYVVREAGPVTVDLKEGARTLATYVAVPIRLSR